MLTCTRSIITFRSQWRRTIATLSNTELADVDAWIQKVTRPKAKSEIETERRKLLYVLPSQVRWLESGLPTRRQLPPFDPSKPLPLGYHFAFPQVFSHTDPDITKLGEDGTAPSDYFDVPSPFTGRMWASGTMQVSPERPFIIENGYSMTNEIVDVQKKGFDEGDPKLFFKRRFEWTAANASGPSYVEERIHVFLTPRHNRRLRKVSGLPEPQFKLTYTPSSTLLFRFSAVSQNDHKIHYDETFCREKEGLRGTAVHGPLTSLLLLDFANQHKPPKTQIKSFEYRATNPLICNERCTLHGSFTDENHRTMKLWACNEDDVVGMVAEAHF